MVDIETMSTSKDAAILTIGAVKFDPYTLNRSDDFIEGNHIELFGPISLDSNEKYGRHMSASTITWWFQQTREAQQAMFSGKGIALQQALYNFRRWIMDSDDPAPNRIWAKDPDFDCTILISAMNAVNEHWPFKFWESRSVRTVTELAYPNGDEPEIRIGTHHNALDDAISQVLMVQHCIHQLSPLSFKRT